MSILFVEIPGSKLLRTYTYITMCVCYPRASSDDGTDLVKRVEQRPPDEVIFSQSIRRGLLTVSHSASSHQHFTKRATYSTHQRNKTITTDGQISSHENLIRIAARTNFQSTPCWIQPSTVNLPSRHRRTAPSELIASEFVPSQASRLQWP